MKRRLRILASPNADLAVDTTGRVYKLKPGGWKRLETAFPLDGVILRGRAPAQSIEVVE